MQRSRNERRHIRAMKCCVARTTSSLGLAASSTHPTRVCSATEPHGCDHRRSKLEHIYPFDFGLKDSATLRQSELMNRAVLDSMRAGIDVLDARETKSVLLSSVK